MKKTIELCTIVLTMTAASHFSLSAQPSGEPIVASGLSGFYQFVGSDRDFTLKELRTSQSSGNTYYQPVLSWRAPAGREIKGFNAKKGNSEVIFILLDDGSVYETISSSFPFANWSTPTFRSKTDPTGNYSGFTKMVGDALYTLSISGVFVSRDTATSWSLDTAGVGGGSYNDIAIDSLQYVYLAHGNGLFKQHPDSSVWHKIASFPGPSAVSVFVDRLNRIYASTYGGIYESTNGGSTWTTRTTGFTAGSVTHFGDDAFRTVYALGGGMVFRSDSGTAAWTRIDTAITHLIHDPINSYLSPFVSVGGDTILLLGTSYGMFQSSDRGTTWSEANSNVRAASLFGYARTSSRQFASTTLGLYYKGLSDSVWTKAFPAKGYQNGGPIFVDTSGNLYSLGPIINFNNSQSPNANWKSTDNGTSWSPDTAGLGVMSAGSIAKYFADEAGIQHYAAIGIPAECYLKTSGSGWTPDTAGWWRLPANYPNVITSDGHGYLYAALTTTTDYTGLLLKRPIAGGTWTFDTAGLNKAIVYSLSSDQNGSLYAGTWGGGIYKRTGTTWAPVSLPGGLLGNNAFVTAVDRQGALFAGFSYQSGYNYAWQGIYYTTNNGSSWTNVGLDSVAVRQLVVYGDSIYAVTYYDGLSVLTRNAATAVLTGAPSVPASYTLFQNYPNPFNPTTVISFQLSAVGKTSLKIYDLLGREVETLVDEELTPGMHRVSFDASKLASGIYFYSLESGSFRATKKLILLK